ncbi:MAG: TlpA family protein disulfide reductase [Salinibacterium sp.]|nr:TlpA family protein disulfide reductase [Salinibacterium sp.]
MNRRLLAVTAAALVTVALAGCSNDPLAQQYAESSGQGYVSGDGAYTEIPPADRGEAIEYSGTTEAGDTVSSADFAGTVYVINFWYAGCPPCRLEAPDLKAVSEEYTDVGFLGVNVSDTAENAITFEKKYEIAYPSIIDAQTNSVQLAFAGQGAVAPNAVPTTLIIDREGRVAGRISGLIQEKSILTSMIDTVLAEGN